MSLITCRALGRSFRLHRVLTLTLLLFACPSALADEPLVHCMLMKDWPPYKAPSLQLFRLPDADPVVLASAIREAREHCHFTLASIDIDVSGKIDTLLETAIRKVHTVLMSDDLFQLKLRWPTWGIKMSVKSLGGDVDTALRIARMLRELQAWVWVSEECSSSCVFLLAAGVQRTTLDARVGIHRPYFTNLSAKAPAADVSRTYAEERERIARFLSDMNVPLSLLEAMEATRPERILYLSKNELSLYRLDYHEPIFEERLVARHAAQRGITSAEYRKRSAQGIAICGDPNACEKILGPGGAAAAAWPADALKINQYFECTNNNFRCHEALTWGLSLPEYVKRREKADRCPEMPHAIETDKHLETNCEKETMLAR
jgi:ATP-dependent protease ClpP protease subunit